MTESTLSHPVPKNQESKICKQCGNVFYRPNKYGNKQWENRSCCSKKCGTDSQLINEKDIPFKFCDFCGKKYHRPRKVYGENWDNRRFCSHKCGILNLHSKNKDKDLRLRHLLSRTITTDTGCMEYQGGRNEDGYGQASVFGLFDKAHRHIYRLIHGEIPKGMCICHHCDNPPCINPDHLFMGTNLDNVRDKVEKGRQPKGDKIWKSVLNEKTKAILVDLARKGMLYDDISKIVGVSARQVSTIANMNGIRRMPYYAKKKL